jgi:hypothetical protein
MKCVVCDKEIPEGAPFMAYGPAENPKIYCGTECFDKESEPETKE